MTTNSFDIDITVSVSIPIIGDKSIALLSPPNGFSFKETLLEEYIYRDKITDKQGRILSEYRGAVFGDNQKCIIYLESNFSCTVKHDKPANTNEFINGSDFKQLVVTIQEQVETKIFQFFSLLHLFKEGEFARKHSFYSYNAEARNRKFNEDIVSYIADIVTYIQYPMVICPLEVGDANNFLYCHEQAYQLLKTIVIDQLEYTYHTFDDATNYKNMMTPLEVMFLKNEHGEKKQMLAKRIAALLGNNDTEMKQIYDNVINHYVDRSDAIHEGTTAQITRTTLDELRNLVRACTKQYICIIENELLTNNSATFQSIKDTLITHLKTTVQSKNAQNIW